MLNFFSVTGALSHGLSMFLGIKDLPQGNKRLGGFAVRGTLAFNIGRSLRVDHFFLPFQGYFYFGRCRFMSLMNLNNLNSS